MPTRPLHPCRHPGCPELLDTKEAYCPIHKKIRIDRYEKTREKTVARGYDTRIWGKVRKVKLERNPLCERCEAKGLTTEARLVHHKDRNPHNNDMDNLESLCNACHELEHKSDRFRQRY